MTTKSDFIINQDDYVAFDAISLKDLIIERMNDQQIFTDQNYEGSNLSSVIDIIAYSYHVLLFYLNKNSAESNFSSADLYENINQIVKSIDYNPTGPQTPNLSFEAIANANLAKNIYTIPRYSYFTFGGTTYSFTTDVFVQKTITGVEALTDLQNNNLLYNGQFVELPIVTAIGEDFEVVTLAPTNTDSNFYIDNNNIDIYVKSVGLSTKWEKWERTTSLYLENASSQKYSVRYNENDKYEIKFGNNINGKRLSTGDQIAIYFLKSDGTNGEVSKNTINNQQLYFYNTTRFTQIKSDVGVQNVITPANAANISFTNKNSSTAFKTKESVSEIKSNAPKLFNSQYRLVTTADYKNYILKNFGNWVKSASVVNNHDYLNGYQKYFFATLNVDRPNSDSRVLFNQINFADACDFNNIYIFAVPNKVVNSSLDIRTNYLSIAQKNAINILLGDIKSATVELIVTDPIYMEVDFGISPGTSISPTTGDASYIYVEVSSSSKRDLESVKNDVTTIFTNYFSQNNLLLGQTISLQDLTQSILSVDGVETFSTRRLYDGVVTSGDRLFLTMFNPVYPNTDYIYSQQNITLPYYQFPYFNDLTNIDDRIVVIRQG